MKYRSRTEIVGLILDAPNRRGSAKTKIMYKAFLSFAQLREYLTMLQDNGLIEFDGGRQTCKTAEKGMKLLEIYKRCLNWCHHLRQPQITGSELEDIRNQSKGYNKINNSSIDCHFGSIGW